MVTDVNTIGTSNDGTTTTVNSAVTNDNHVLILDDYPPMSNSQNSDLAYNDNNEVVPDPHASSTDTPNVTSYDSEEEFMDGDRPLTFTGLGLEDFADMPVLILDGVTSGETCDFEEMGETSDDVDIDVEEGMSGNLNELAKNKGKRRINVM